MRDPAEVLLSDELIRRDGERTRTTPRWQAAMARAALKLQRDGAPWRDVRLPVVAALVERYPDATDEEIVALVEVMAPVEEAELERAWGETPGAR